ncbi:MAG: NAD(P)-dependent oxidoreductase [Phycisphaerae bacterium]|nr:NAD(P)-dependent oxidoreductase [Phycisphaerae bacterium]NNF44364.1 NAD(P)-dependent oxidoreductase [Phycisphaerales bacterium]
MKYCITGGSGFIGSYFCDALAEAGHHLTILDLVEPPATTPHDRYVRGDIRDADACRAALAGCDRLLHLAAAHHDFGIAHDTYFSVNEGAAETLADILDETGVRQMCFYSTVALYGDAPRPHEETTTPQPNSPYGASKLAGEEVFRRWTERGDGRRCLVIRPTVTFGPRNFANMYSLIRQIYNRKFVFVGPATNIKSLSYIENIVDATLYLLDRPELPAFDVYNYVEKPDLTSRAISETIFQALGRTPPRIGIPMWAARLAALPFDAVIAVTGKNIPISTARVKKLFTVQTKFESDKVRAAGFEPRIALREGIERMVQWYEREGKDQRADWHIPPEEPVRFDAEA